MTAFGLLVQPLIAAESTISETIAKLKSTDRATAVAAARSLALTQEDAATAALIAQLKATRDDYMKIQIIELLSVNRSTPVAGALIAAAHSANPVVRQAAVNGLGLQPEDPRIIAELAGALSRDPDLSVQKFALNSLGMHLSTAAVETTSAVLSDRKKSRELRLIAVNALATMNSRSAAAKLDAAADDPDKDIRAAIAAARAARAARAAALTHKAKQRP